MNSEFEEVRKKLGVLREEIARSSLKQNELYEEIAEKDLSIKQLKKEVEVLQKSILKNKEMSIFYDIYNSRSWSSEESLSGKGSEVEQSSGVINQLPKVLESLEVTRLLDIPCGDFNWMKQVDLDAIKYIGGDIVSGLISSNQQYSNKMREFQAMDISSTKLPSADIIFSRDCLVHFSFKNIYKTLENICKSDIKYIMMTHFLYNRLNLDIPTGKWRTLNFELQPFNFPSPLTVIIEGTTQDNFKYIDKCLGVWDVPTIRSLLPSIRNNIENYTHPQDTVLNNAVD